MSLRAKIEAVVYAAEEPVTLGQITALFQAELLEERTTRVSAEAAAQEEFVSESEVVTQPALGIPSAEAEKVNRDDAAAAEPVAEEGELSPEDEKKAARQKEREARDEAKRIMGQLIAEYDEGDRGIEIREIAGGYRLGTKPEYHDAVRSFVKSLKPPMKLSLQALETLAVIAYKQPVTAPEISEIRGVDSGGVLGSLVSRKLITTAGRKQVIGRPILYKTTKEFLLRFGLKDLNELPSIEEFEKMAGELAEMEDATPGNELPFEGAAGEEMAGNESGAEAAAGEPAEEAAREGSE
ncbi:MAG TPA: SMC-Scp complex subunit ScpB [Acidobacteriaceae bacterium]|nr:SMC-Scp complex subunit ScpB [Acidobacteriaceae bacterium]